MNVIKCLRIIPKEGQWVWVNGIRQPIKVLSVFRPERVFTAHYVVPNDSDPKGCLVGGEYQMKDVVFVVNPDVEKEKIEILEKTIENYGVENIIMTCW